MKSFYLCKILAFFLRPKDAHNDSCGRTHIADKQWGLLFYLNANIMAWYFPQSHLFLLLLVLWIRGNVSFVLESAESLLLTSLSNMGRNAEAEGRRRKVKEMRRKIFLLYSFISFFEYFFLWWWYGKLRGRLRGCSGLFLHIIFVSFSPRKSWKSERVWQWHFRQLKRFHFIARMDFMKRSPILLFHFVFLLGIQASMKTIFPFLLLYYSERGRKHKKATQRFKC